MYGYVLQDWITIRGSNIADIKQTERDWMGFSSFQDLVLWLDVREVSYQSGGSVDFYLDTAPSKDEALFQSMMQVTGIAAGTGPYTSSGALPKTLLVNNPAVPLGTWVRWRLSPQGTSGPWDVTFRVLVTANRVSPARFG